MKLLFQPMPLQKWRLPFDHPEWLFELKYDGFRAMLHIRPDHCQLNLTQRKSLRVIRQFSAQYRGLAAACP
jgi:ATP-dependent DNA ligase